MTLIKFVQLSRLGGNECCLNTQKATTPGLLIQYKIFKNGLFTL